MATEENQHLADAIQQTICEDRFSGKYERKFYISDSLGCQRMRWVKRKGVDQTFDDYVQWLLKIGELYHDFAYDCFRNKGLLIDTEETLETEDYKGRFDARVWMPEKSGKAIADIKSAGEYPMKKIIVDNEVDSSYIAQVLTYVYFDQKLNKSKDNTGILVFINKNPGNKGPYVAVQKEYSLDNVYRKKIIKDMDELSDHWHNDTIPPCTCSGWKKSYGGKYNNFYPFCRASEQDIRKALDYLGDPDYQVVALGTQVDIVNLKTNTVTNSILK